MSDTTTPAGDDTRRDLIDLPPKIRVHALAKLLGASSREVLGALADLNEEVRSAQSSVSREVAQRVVDALAPADDAPSPAAAEPVEATDTVDTTDTADTSDVPEVAEVAKEPRRARPPKQPLFASASPLFLPPEATARPARPAPVEEPVTDEAEAEADESDDADGLDEDGNTRRRRRRGRRGRGRGKGTLAEDGSEEQDDDAEEEPAVEEAEAQDAEADEDAQDAEDGVSRRRRRRRRRKGSDGDESSGGDDDPPNTVVHVREARDEKAKPEKPAADRDEVRSVRGSTRLEAKRQRRRDGREAGRRRAPILSEAEFLTRRESVDRKMVVRERSDRTQIGVLEDGVLVEHFVTSSGTGSLVGNVYLGRVQNVLPSMEAAFVDIGRGRNAVLYAGEVDWDAAGLEGKARRIEQALSTGDSVLVQVTKDPVGHKGARLTTQISLPGRFLVYVPGGGATGISRKLPENERRRLKDILKRIVPEDAGVIIRTASEGISEDELARDVRRLQAQWQVIKDKAEGSDEVKKATAPTLLYEEPDLLVKVVRDLFTEDFSGLVVQGDDAWDTIDAYVRHVAPDLQERLSRHVGTTDVFTEYRIDEQLLKALDRKVWLPSGGYLVIDRTEAMTVIDVNTGKFTGSGGNLEETVTRNNLESAEEIVRQLRLRDIGGIIVIDFIDMVLESNRDLVLRRLTECLGRDRTRHQVAEVTSLGLVQMTRKRVGTGLLEAFSATCEHCRGRGVIVSTEPIVRSNGGNGNGNGHQHSHAAPPKPPKAEEKPQQPERAESQRTRERPSRAERRAKAERARAEAAEAAATPNAETTAEPAAEPVKTAADTAQAAATELATPAADSAAESAKAVTGSAGPAAESATTAAESANTAAESAKAAVEPADAATESAEPATTAAGSARPATESAESVTEPAKAATESAKTGEVVAASGEAAAEPAEAPVAAADVVDLASEPGLPPVEVTKVNEDFEVTVDNSGVPEAPLEPALNGHPSTASSEVPQGVDDDVVLVPRRQRRRSASRPAGPPVNAGQEG
ncbi:translation initiation factor IF-2 N-terminal domain-containing protein [Actinocrispum wychmicini]|uniref:Ribonuclease E n=1 Tax=Actinocrispum wychmicini TaxID=1213861 RepID=A0A4R2J6H9_9PSEU|nr:translation initiation factor IF-2 N-terminal domain-containing protein [Actinocrispum wychmicini]TCO50775.1 ribonuclease E [Actinocrispum wychmicini]